MVKRKSKTRKNAKHRKTAKGLFNCWSKVITPLLI